MTSAEPRTIRLSTIDDRMERFVANLGEVPPDARRLADFEAAEHHAQWVRRLVGKGISSHAIGYTLADRWWTYCFERLSQSSAPGSEEQEAWSIEAYDSTGKSWTETFYYDPAEGRWRYGDTAV